MSRSFTLTEAAERIGLTEKELRRHIELGAFPGRFLRQGSDRVEMCLPVSEVEAFERLSAGPTIARAMALAEDLDLEPVLVEGEISEGTESGAYRRLFVDMVDSERAAFFEVVRRAWVERDDELAELRTEVEALRGELREAMARVGEAMAGGRDATEPSGLLRSPHAVNEGIDIDSVFREIKELEAMLGLEEKSH